MTQDPELQSMQRIVEILGEITPEQRGRIVAWLSKRYVVARTPIVERLEAPTNEGAADDFADLLDSANPQTDVDRAVVAAYWHQVIGGQDNLVSQHLNDSLKDAGHGITNITRALTDAQQRRPALVRQIQKTGKTQQARKKSRLTAAGISYVRNLLSEMPTDDEIIS